MLFMQISNKAITCFPHEPLANWSMEPSVGITVIVWTHLYYLCRAKKKYKKANSFIIQPFFSPITENPDRYLNSQIQHVDNEAAWPSSRKCQTTHSFDKWNQPSQDIPARNCGCSLWWKKLLQSRLCQWSPRHKGDEELFSKPKVLPQDHLENTAG